jgi:hypothetical protein
VIQIRALYCPSSKHVPAGTCPLETLYGISALGTKLCFYSLDTSDDAVIVPAPIARHPLIINDTAPANRWDCDILEPAGEERLTEVVQKIKDRCAALDLQ